MLYLLAWILFGIIMIFGASAIHLYTAEKQGYEAVKWWTENGPTLIDSYQGNLAVGIIFGLLIWPVRYIQFTCSMSTYYSLYELKDEEL